MKYEKQYCENNFIDPAFNENNIAIFFNNDNKYAPYLATTINSLVNKSSNKSNYDLIVLTDDMSKNNICILKSIIEQKNNFSLRFVDMKSYYYKYNIASLSTPNGHVSLSSYYRIFAPWIFMNYENIIYLDSDLIVNTDIAEFTNIPFEDKAVIAVADYYMSDPDFTTPDYKFTKYSKEILKIDSLSTYFNSGVMNLNLKKIREKYSIDKFVETAKINNYRFNDQNVMNSVLYGDIKLVESEWNFHNPFDLHPILLAKYGKPIDMLKIIHFCGQVKPWQDMNLRFADIWWYYARGTMFYEQLLMNVIKGCSFDDIAPSTTHKVKKDEIINEIALAFLRRKYWKYRIFSKITFGRTKTKYIRKKALYLDRLNDIINFSENNTK